MILVLYWTNDIQWFLVLYWTNDIQWFVIISLSLLWQHAPMSVVKTCENHSQPGVKFFASHGATPHRNPRNLRHPTPDKPSPGPHGPQVYHMCRTKTIPSHGRFMPLGLVTYRKTSQPSDTATVTGSPFPAGCRDRSMGCVRSSIPACHGMCQASHADKHEYDRLPSGND